MPELGPSLMDKRALEFGDTGANTVSTIRPAGEVVSAQGSESERKPASVSLILGCACAHSVISLA
jgi:hypothetical protein